MKTYFEKTQLFKSNSGTIGEACGRAVQAGCASHPRRAVIEFRSGGILCWFRLCVKIDDPRDQGIVLGDKAVSARTREAICGNAKGIGEKAMIEMRVELCQVSPSTSEARLRTHRVLIDRPQERNGADKGPMGGELFLASIGGCFMSNLLAAINARKSDISDVRTEVTGTISETPARFSAIELQSRNSNGSWKLPTGATS